MAFLTHGLSWKGVQANVLARGSSVGRDRAARAAAQRSRTGRRGSHIVMSVSCLDLMKTIVGRGISLPSQSIAFDGLCCFLPGFELQRLLRYTDGTTEPKCADCRRHLDQFCLPQAHHRLGWGEPPSYPYREYVALGGLMAYAVDCARHGSTGKRSSKKIDILGCLR